MGQVVEHVVGVAGSAEHRRAGRREPVQAVVAHRPVAALPLARGRVGHVQHVADLVVGVLVLVDGGRSVGVLARRRQAAGVLRQRVDDAVAVGELLERAVGVVADVGGVKPACVGWPRALGA